MPGALTTLAIELSNPPQKDSAPNLPAISRGPPCSGVVVGMGGPKGRITVGARVACGQADDLMPAIAAALKETGLSPGAIECVAVSIGPGGYTSLRMAVTAAKMICLVSGAKCIPVPTASALLGRVPTEVRESQPVLITLAWKRHETWRARFEAGAETAASSGIISLDELAREMQGVHLVADHRLLNTLVEGGASIDSAKISEPIFDPESVLKASAEMEPIDIHELAPMYARLPEAVRLWEQRKG